MTTETTTPVIDEARLNAEATKLMAESSEAWVILEAYAANLTGMMTAVYPVMRSSMLHHDEIIEWIDPKERPRFEETLEEAKRIVADINTRILETIRMHKNRSGIPTAEDNAMGIADRYTEIANDIADVQAGALHVLTVTVNDWLKAKGESND